MTFHIDTSSSSFDKSKNGKNDERNNEKKKD